MKDWAVSLPNSFNTNPIRTKIAPIVPIIVTISMVPAGGVAPPSRVYESLVLTLELRRHGQIRNSVYMSNDTILNISSFRNAKGKNTIIHFSVFVNLFSFRQEDNLTKL